VLASTLVLALAVFLVRTAAHVISALASTPGAN
jgi:hypothetical protein